EDGPPPPPARLLELGTSSVLGGLEDLTSTRLQLDVALPRCIPPLVRGREMLNRRALRELVPDAVGIRPEPEDVAAAGVDRPEPCVRRDAAVHVLDGRAFVRSAHLHDRHLPAWGRQYRTPGEGDSSGFRTWREGGGQRRRRDRGGPRRPPFFFLTGRGRLGRIRKALLALEDRRHHLAGRGVLTR